MHSRSILYPTCSTLKFTTSIGQRPTPWGDQFPPGLKFTLQGCQRQAGGPPQAPRCIIYAALIHTEEGIWPPPHPRTSTQAQGGRLPHQAKEMTANGPRGR